MGNISAKLVPNFRSGEVSISVQVPQILSCSVETRWISIIVNALETGRIMNLCVNVAIKEEGC